MPPLTVPKVKPGVLMNVLLAVSVMGPIAEAGLSEVLNGNQFYIEYSKQILNEL